MPVSSLPGPYGIGCFGKEAFEFVDFLAQAGQKIWQILPPVSYTHLDVYKRQVLSSRGMNSDGGTQPRVGWFQRTSASMPTMARVMLLHLGCRKKQNS